MRSLARLGLACMLGTTLACGTESVNVGDAGSGDAGSGDAAPILKRYLPLAVGAKWTYLVSDPKAGTAETKTSTVEAFEDVGGAKAGVKAFRVRTEKLDGVTVSWQEDLGDKVVRHEEEARDLQGTLVTEEVYVPSKLRLDETAEHTTASASWIVKYTETVNDAKTGSSTNDKTEAWSVIGTDETVIVPAGTFRCLHVRRVGDVIGQAEKDYYFARGVGKVKELGKQTEELDSYTVP